MSIQGKHASAICHVNVNVGTGGLKNFEIHLASKKHLMNVKAEEKTGMSKAVKTNIISDFFCKATRPSSTVPGASCSTTFDSEYPHLDPSWPFMYRLEHR